MNRKINPGIRIKKIAEQVGHCKTVADIGTDHGYLLIYIIQNEIAANGIGVDIHESPAENAKDNIDKYGLSDKLTIRIGDGTEPISDDDEVSIFTVAGIGGLAVSQIMERGKEHFIKAERIVLQPSNREDILRGYLFENGYDIERETFVEEAGRIFIIFNVKYTGEIKKYTTTELLYGNFILMNDKVTVMKYLEKKLKYINKAIDEISTTEQEQEKMNEMSEQRDAVTSFILSLT